MERIQFLTTMIAALGSGLIAGTFFVFSVAVMRALGQRPANEGMAAMQAINIVILNPIFLGVFLGTTIVSLLAALLRANASFFVYSTVFHYESHVLHSLDVAQWIAGDRYDVCELARLERTDILLPPEKFRGIQCSGHDGIHRAQAAPVDHQHKFMKVTFFEAVATGVLHVTRN